MRNFFLPSGKDESGNIPGIYNYCNRICERCNFTAMCLCYKMLPSIINDQNLDDSTNNIGVFGDSILQPADLLLNHAEREYDYQTDDLLTDFKNQIDESHKIISEYEIIKKASEYCNRVQMTFEILDETSYDPGQDITSAIQKDIQQLSKNGRLEEFLERSSRTRVLSYVIVMKLHRAVSGHFNLQMENDDEFEEFDMNGSAKCVLVSIDESIDEMLAVHTFIPTLTEEASNLYNILVEIRTATEAFFPNARTFIRPGLDE